MTSESIYQLLQSYASFRTAVLRTMAFEEVTKAEFTRLTGLNAGAKRIRQLNPSLWQPTEIHTFAPQLTLWDGQCHRLGLLATQINTFCSPQGSSY